MTSGSTGRRRRSSVPLRHRPLAINPIIYAEVSIGFDRIEDLNAALPDDYFERRAAAMGSGVPGGQVLRAVTAVRAASRQLPSRISTSGRTPPSRASRCSRETHGDTARIFQSCRSSRRSRPIQFAIACHEPFTAGEATSVDDRLSHQILELAPHFLN